ncbi:MAG: hypothetical protein C0597_02325 [Marinilabiliales bacterium]|nr:MAG: hypothetical protein C0597_02325 [Marinilabiliales bacterium]
MKSILHILLVFSIIIWTGSCRNNFVDDGSVRVDDDFKDLFYADSNGITGADGIFSIELLNGSSIFLLGDCFLGTVKDGARDFNTTMLRNAFIVLDKGQAHSRAIYKGEYEDPVTLMKPVNAPGDSTYRWYWPAHGFVKHDTMYVFSLNMYNEPSSVEKSDKPEEELDEVDKLAEDKFAFRVGGIDLHTFTLPDFKYIETKKAGFNYAENKIDFGNCVMVDGEYVYIYGTKNSPGLAKVHTARVPLNSKTFHNNWEYSTGDGWDKDIKRSIPIEIDLGVSEQFSIFKFQEKYILLTQERGGEDIFTYTSDYPNKGFSNKKFIYHTPEHDLDSTKKIHTYNALAHPQFIENNELLVSYCVNSIRVRDVFENVENYRARFIRVPMNLILNENSKENLESKQKSAELKPLSFSAEPAPEWTALMERSSGWFGADGIFSIPLDGIEDQNNKDKKTLFIFSDTYIGEVENGVPKPGNVMVNNTVAWMTGVKPDKSKILFEYNKDMEGNPISYFTPDNKNSKDGEYFWLGDGFINHKKDALYIFAYHVHKTGPNVFDFEQTNISLLKIDKPTSKGIRKSDQIPTDLGFVHPEYGRIYFGSGIFVNTKKANAPNPDGYVYIYGIAEGNKSLLAAKVKPDKFEDIAKWTFWDGIQWVSNKEKAVPITNGVSNELSVTPTEDGRYLLTFTVLGLSEKIGIRVGDSPVGPFGEIHEVYTCPEYAEKGLLPYNAKAHYHLSSPGELLISYNTITFDFWEDIQKDASIYHPRFIKVKYK